MAIVDDEAFMAEIQSNDRRRQLIALRDLIANELSGSRCSKCHMFQMRSGETAALVLRLQKVIEDLDAIPGGPDAKEGEGKQKGGLKLIQSRRPTAEEGGSENLGTKAGPRRQSTRRRS